MFRLVVFVAVCACALPALAEEPTCVPTGGDTGSCVCDCTCDGECPDPMGSTLVDVPTTATPPVVDPTTIPVCESGAIDVCFALDMSHSIRAENWEKIIAFTANTIAGLDVAEDNVHIGVVRFAGRLDTSVDADLTIFDKDALVAVVEGLPYEPSQRGAKLTKTNEGLKECRNLFKGPNGREGQSTQVFVVVTDGRTTEPGSTAKEVQMLRDCGAQGIAVGVSDQINEEELENLSTADPPIFFKVEGFDDLNTVRDELTNRICEYGQS